MDGTVDREPKSEHEEVTMAQDSLDHALGRLDVTVPEQVFEAGKLGTVSILIRNPFDSPIEVLEIQGPRSSDLRDDHGQIVANTRLARRNAEGASESWFRKIGNALGLFSISEVSFAGVTVEFPQSRRTMNIKAEKNAKLTFDRELDAYDTFNIAAEEGAEINFSPPQQQVRAHTPQIIQRIEPHCESVAYLSVSTIGWLLFKPTKLHLSSLIKYRINGLEKTQVVQTSFDVKPPVMSMVIGAIIGAILGNLAKSLNTPIELSWPNMLIAIGGSVIMR